MDENKIKIAIEASTEQVEKAFSTIEQKIKSLLPNIDKLTKGFKSLDNDLGKLGKNNNLDKLSKSIDKVSKSVNGLNTSAKSVKEFSNAINNISNTDDISKLANTLSTLSNINISSLGKSVSNIANIESIMVDTAIMANNTAEINKNTEAKKRNIDNTSAITKAKNNLKKYIDDYERFLRTLYGLEYDTNEIQEQINNVKKLTKDATGDLEVSKISLNTDELEKIKASIDEMYNTLSKIENTAILPESDMEDITRLLDDLETLNGDIVLTVLNDEDLLGVKEELNYITEQYEEFLKVMNKNIEMSVDTDNIYALCESLNIAQDDLLFLEKNFKEVSDKFKNAKLNVTDVDKSSVIEIDQIIKKIAQLQVEMKELKDEDITPGNVKKYTDEVIKLTKRFEQLDKASEIGDIRFNSDPLRKIDVKGFEQKLVMALQGVNKLGDAIKLVGNTKIGIALNINRDFEAISGKAKEVKNVVTNAFNSLKAKTNTIIGTGAIGDFIKLANHAKQTGTVIRNIFLRKTGDIISSKTYKGLSNFALKAKGAFNSVTTAAKTVGSKVKEVFNKIKPKIEPKIEQPKVLSAAKGLISKLIALFSAAAIGKALTSSITEAMSIIETENLFETITNANLAEETNMVKKYGLTTEDATNKTEQFTQAQEELRNKMSGANAEAEEFVNNMSEILGLNIKNVKNDYAVFYGMANGMGLANEASTQLSKGMTMLTQDMASFYNRDAKDVTKDMQSALTGEYVALRRYGIVISEALLKQRAYEAGMKIQNGTLTAAQKAILTYNEILRQSKNAQGDLAKTLDSPANKLRIFKERLVDLKQALGNAFMPIVDVVLPLLTKLVGYLVTAANAAGAFIQRLLAPFQKLKEVTVSDEIKEAGKDLADDTYNKIDANEALKNSYGEVAGGIDEMGNAIEDAGKKAKGQLARVLAAWYGDIPICIG